MEPFLLGAAVFVLLLLGYVVGKRQGEINKLMKGGKQPPFFNSGKRRGLKFIKGGKE